MLNVKFSTCVKNLNLLKSRKLLTVFQTVLCFSRVRNLFDIKQLWLSLMIEWE